MANPQSRRPPAHQDAAPPPGEAALETPLAALHARLGGVMVDFAGWSLPVRYPAGTLAEHAACREGAALFDVSHMGQLRLETQGGATAAAQALEALCPGGLATLKPGDARYTQFTNEAGGVIDDLIVSHAGDSLFIVVNAARREADLARLAEALDPDATVTRLDRALLAVQGPKAAALVGELVPQAAALRFMQTAAAEWRGAEARVSRLGYTGEDGFEISLPTGAAEPFAEALIAAGAVPAGLGARDTLRLEAGLPLWGHELDETTTPVEAGLAWSIPKRRREAANFPGAAVILRQIAEGPARRLVGVRPDGAAPAREGTVVTARGAPIGAVTSGGYGPTVGGPVAMAFVAAAVAEPGTALELVVRGKPRPAGVVPLPFVPHRYFRGA
ncbi:glycine cleavage system aminomethyltransferase GcvT [Rubrimonas cliftonensis]|uniref:aminomethyltransferase n=1 Tax=Rubrimonas cliftonensis TaxID=89524 RepID=A0A1H4FLW2_9RHOB|nr:glycine cleavage system aminomethyltransferase GcvT [Rubrimonas cliftonensis]SEA97482.1 aminomethyltransferase [Rubrimonas cliftonensis]